MDKPINSSKKNILVISIFIILFLSVSLNLFLVFYSQQNSNSSLDNKPSDINKEIPNSLATPDILKPTTIEENKEVYSLELLNTNAPLEQIIIENNDTQPQYNAVYLGKYNGENILFLQNWDTTRNNLTFAEIENNNSTKTDISFNQIENPVKIYQGEDQEEIYFSGFKLTSDESKIFFGINFDSTNNTSDTVGYPDKIAIFEIDLINKTKKVLYLENIFETKFADYAGSLSVEDLINDKYLIVRAGYCYACDEVPPGGVVITNLENGKAIHIGDVGNLKIDINSNSFTANKNIAVKNPNCNSEVGYCASQYLPNGESVSAQLP